MTTQTNNSAIAEAVRKAHAFTNKFTAVTTHLRRLDASDLADVLDQAVDIINRLASFLLADRKAQTFESQLQRIEDLLNRGEVGDALGVIQDMRGEGKSRHPAHAAPIEEHATGGSAETDDEEICSICSENYPLDKYDVEEMRRRNANPAGEPLTPTDFLAVLESIGDDMEMARCTVEVATMAIKEISTDGCVELAAVLKPVNNLLYSSIQRLSVAAHDMPALNKVQP